MKIPEYLMAHAKKFREEHNAVLEASKPRELIKDNEILPGQIWKVSFIGQDGVRTAIFALTLTAPFQETDKLSKAIRIAPIHNTPHLECICKETDLFLPPKSVPIKVASLIEWWNDRPIKLSQLKVFFGKLDKPIWDSVQKFLAERPRPTQSKLIDLFREEEIAVGGLISKHYMQEMFA